MPLAPPAPCIHLLGGLKIRSEPDLASAAEASEPALRGPRESSLLSGRCGADPATPPSNLTPRMQQT
ncbi:hypothetical protein EYF80_040780 [Liparis tanakae]|uniref:Uncharacterized protein n=1 Tax=Liparis tanakae TaxID=230148 RepID=A0A4Z2G623_9TELE|nr:hypothetical protein EYF80_040780 [Liparis tanakae]